MKYGLLRFSLLSMLVMLCGGSIMAGNFRDIKINFTDADKWQALGTGSNVYITVDGEGAISTTENSAEAAATLKGSWHGTTYGWQNFTASVPVEGCVKITYGMNDFGNEVTVTNSNNEEVAKLNNLDGTGKWSSANPDQRIAVAYYRTNAATTLNFSKCNYLPYFAVEAIDEADLPALETNHNVTFAAGEGTGVAPATQQVKAGSKITAPKNYTLYKDGATLTGWSDGTKTYAIGAEITPEADMTLTAVYTTNEVSLADRTETVTVNFPLNGSQGNFTINNSGIIVTQVTINSQTIDVKADITAGTLATNNGGWHQVKNNFKATIPSCKGATVAISTYNDPTSLLTFGGSTDFNVTGANNTWTATYTATAADETLEIAQTGSTYWNNLVITLPAEAQGGSDLNITWSMKDGASSKETSNPAEDILSASWSVASDLAIDGTATATYFGNTYTRFTRVGSSKLDNIRDQLNNSYVEFKFKPVTGLTITPTAISFDITKVSTGDPNIWVECVQGNNATSIAANVAIRKNSEATPSEHQSFDLTTVNGITSTSDETAFRIYIGKLANTKQVAIANVAIAAKVNGSIQKFTTVYDLATTMYNSTSNFENNTGEVDATTAEAAANAPKLKVDATSGKLGKNNADWAQLGQGTVLTLPGVPQGAEVTFALYDNTALTINDVAYTNGQKYTAAKDENLTMTCTTGGYIKSITVEGSAFVTVLDTEGYTHTWQFGKSNGAQEFKLEKSAEYTYEVEGRSLVINTAAGKLNNAGRTDEWAQCNEGTLFKVPVYAGSKLSWGRYATGEDAGFTIDGQLYNTYYIATEDGTAEIKAHGIGHLSYIKIEPATLYEATGTIEGGNINGSIIKLTAAGNGQPYSATIASNAFTVKVPADTYTFDLSDDVAYVVNTPENAVINADGNIGVITITAAQPQTVTGQIANAPAEAFILTFTGASHNKQVECDANATSFKTTLDPDTYTISSSVGTLSNLSKASFKVLKAEANHNIYFPEAAVPAATQQNITVDNTATVEANTYKTVTDALAAAKAGNISKPVITLTSGQTYQEQVIVDMADVTLKTSGEEKATITFYYGIGYTYYSLGENGYYDKDRANTRNSILMKDPSRWGATVLVTNKGNNFKAENIVFENSFNQRYTEAEVADGVRPNKAQSISYDRTLTEGASGYYAADAKAVTERAAAIAFENNPTGVQLYGCVFRGSQDTFYSSGKIYVKNCNIEGNTDYIFGGGYVVFDNCDLTIGGYSDKETSAYITAYKEGETLNANKKYVFRDCVVKAKDRAYIKANLGRDWGGAAASVYFFNLKNEIGNKLSYSWTNMGGGVTAGTADLHIYDFDPAVNVNYNTTGASGANINGVVATTDALNLYANVTTTLGFTPERIYEDFVELDENSAYNICRIAASNNVNRNVKVTRALSANEWNTIVLPFALTSEQITNTFGENTKVAELTSADNSVLNFTTATAMEANKPYIINVATDFTTATVNNATIVKADAQQNIGDWTVTGLYAASQVPVASYFMSNDVINKAADNTTDINALSAYFTNDAAGTVTYTIDGVVTGIETVKTAGDTINGAIYNLSGLRVGKATKGLYIINGKMVVIK